MKGTMLKKLLILTQVTAMVCAFFVIKASVPTLAFAQYRTCCEKKYLSDGVTIDPTGCDACDTSGKYWKTQEGGNCGGDTNCGICNVDGHIGKPIGNACGGGGTAPTPTPSSSCQNTSANPTTGQPCRYITYGTSKVTLLVGEKKTLTLSYFADTTTSAPLSAITWSVTNPTAVTLGGKASVTKNICCSSVYGNMTQTIVVTGQAVGTSKLNTSIKGSTGSVGCSSTGCLTINVVAPTPSPTPVPTPTPTPPPSYSCDLSVNWTSTGNHDVWKYGDMITFSTSQTASSIPAGATVRYEGELLQFKNNAYVKTFTLTPINATASQFGPVKIDAGNAMYYFRFRYCVKDTVGVETCSNWGSSGAPGY